MHFFPPSLEPWLVDKQPRNHMYCKPAQKARKFGHPGRIRAYDGENDAGIARRAGPG
jgi:hypothetical protein